MKKTWTLIATALASSMAFIDGSALNVALPALQRDLGASGSDLLWIINAYLLMLAALILVGGALGDRLGRRRVYIVGIVVFMLASLGCSLALSATALIAIRVVQGVGGALMIPGSLSLISAVYGVERGQAIGTWSALTTLATLGGPAIGGALADAGLWRGVFLLNLPLGMVALAILLTRVPESHNPDATGALDYVGALLVCFGLAALTYGCLAAGDRGLEDWLVLAALLGGTACLVGFVAVEARAANPMMPLDLFRSVTFSGTNLLTLLLYGALSIGTLFLSLNLVQAQGYSQTQAGLAFIPLSLTLALLSRYTGRLADRLGPRLLLVVGPALVGVGFAMLALVGRSGGPGAYWTSFFPAILVFAVGMALTVAPLTAAVMGSVAMERSGTASGVNNAVSRIAGVLTIAVVGALALATFGQSLDALTLAARLPESLRSAMLADASQLGALALPDGLDAAQRSAATEAISGSLIAAYQRVQWVCAGLAWCGALAAGALVGREQRT